MNSIWDETFFTHCTDTGFEKDSFIRHVLSLKKEGIKRELGLARDGIRRSIFGDYCHIIDCLIHTTNFRTDPDYRINKHLFKDNFLQYGIKTCDMVFKKYPYLKNLDLLQELLKIVLIERAIHISTNIKHKNDIPSLLSLDEFISILKDSIRGVVIKRFYRVYFIKDKIDYKSYGFIYQDDMDVLMMNELLIKEGIQQSFLINPEFDKNLIKYKEDKIRSKMSKVFSTL